MKFATQHKNFKFSRGGKKPESYRAHRQSNQVWVTGGDKNTTIMSSAFKTVSMAKAWMNKPSVST